MNRTVIRSIVSIIVFVMTMMSGHVLHAAQLDDVSLPDQVRLDGTETELQLNGMGYRTKFVFKVYVGALYTEKKVSTRDQVQELAGPKRVLMHIIHDEISADKMASAWRDGFEDNNSEDKLAVLEDRLQTLIGFFDTLRAGDVVLLDYVPGTGTRVSIRGEHKGDIAGEDFYAALLDVWLGEEPADDDLKEAMLGIAED